MTNSTRDSRRAAETRHHPCFSLRGGCRSHVTQSRPARKQRLHLNSSGGLPAQPAAALRRWRALHFLISTFEGPESGDGVLERPLGLYGMQKKKRDLRGSWRLSLVFAAESRGDGRRCWRIKRERRWEVGKGSQGRETAQPTVEANKFSSRPVLVCTRPLS